MLEFLRWIRYSILSDYKAVTRIQNYININKQLTHREIPVKLMEAYCEKHKDAFKRNFMCIVFKNIGSNYVVIRNGFWGYPVVVSNESAE